MKIQKLIFGCLLLASCGEETLSPKAQKSLNQTTNYIEQYKLTYSSLPTRDEYLAWWKTNDLSGVIDYSSTNNEYFIYIWLGEKLVVYSSKDKTIN